MGLGNVARGACLLVVTGCALGRHAPVVVTRDDAQAVAALCAQQPLGPSENVHIVTVERMAAASAHLVQIRRGETPHRHADHDLVVTMLVGEGTLTIGGVSRAMHAGDVAVIPRGTPHWFVNGGKDPAVSLAVFSPPLDAPDSQPVDRVDSAPGAR